MFEIPLFPLNTVLFPGMPLALHIFEERYKLMIGECIKNHRPFGVVLIEEGQEALGPLATPHQVGCTARITQVERLAGGRMNIGAVGRERFRIVSLDRDQPYLVANVEKYPLDERNPEKQAIAAERLRPWVVRYMEALSRVESLDLDPKHLPDEPAPLAYLAATLIQAPNERKQPLLAIETAADLLTDMRALYRREVPLLEAMLEQPVEDLDSFSLN